MGQGEVGLELRVSYSHFQTRISAWGGLGQGGLEVFFISNKSISIRQFRLNAIFVKLI